MDQYYENSIPTKSKLYIQYNPHQNSNERSGMVVHAFNQSTLESEAGESPELEVSQSYIVKACLKIMQFFTETEKETLKYENTKDSK